MNQWDGAKGRATRTWRDPVWGTPGNGWGSMLAPVLNAPSAGTCLGDSSPGRGGGEWADGAGQGPRTEEPSSSEGSFGGQRGLWREERGKWEMRREEEEKGRETPE